MAEGEARSTKGSISLRQNRTERRRKNRRTRQIQATAALAVVVAGVVAGVVATEAGHKSSAAPSRFVPPQGKLAGGQIPEVAQSLCPLTDLPAPGGKVPARPALGVSIGNDPGALPQSGLDHADIVFEVPVEGGITRLIAIYQCSGDTQVGPVRSGRWIDAQIMSQFDHPAFAFAGGIAFDEQTIASAPLFDANFFTYGNAYFRTSNRVPPENLYLNTASIWALDHSRQPPAPIFTYSTAKPQGSPTQSVDIPFSGEEPISWHWDPTAGTWERYYNATPESDADGASVTATNVVIEAVSIQPTSYVEDANGATEIEPITTGSGPAWVLRNGEAIRGTWSRPTATDPALILDRQGKPIPLAPGRTWVEIVPNTVGVSFSS